MSRASHTHAIDAATEQAQSCASKRTRHFRPSHHTEADATRNLKRRSAHEKQKTYPASLGRRTEYCPRGRFGSRRTIGTTSQGGTSNVGTVFKLDTTGTETVLHSFAGAPDGACSSQIEVCHPTFGRLFLLAFDVWAPRLSPRRAPAAELVAQARAANLFCDECAFEEAI